jgi:DnaD/phage-associated family protein
MSPFEMVKVLMSDFQGLPAGKINFDRIPALFFSELMPKIDHLGELKVTLYVLWRLDHMEGDFRYLTVSDFLEDTLFMEGLSDSPEIRTTLLDESLARCVKRGTLLESTIHQGSKQIVLYFFNSPKGRAAIEAIETQSWHPLEFDSQPPIELVPERPNIFQLYEENIGPVTPLLAEALGDAEDEYPASWIEEAFQIAVEKNVRNWRYIAAILRRWQERGFDVREERKRAEEDSSKDFRRYSQDPYAGYIKHEE